MRMSRDHILTSQAGSLPRPDDLISANAARESDPSTDERAFQETLQKAIVDVVRQQKDIGIDVPGDGEFGKSMGHKVNYRAWWSYCFNRLGGLDLDGPGLLRHGAEAVPSPGEVVLTSFADRRDRTKFLPVYQDPDGGDYDRAADGQVAGLHRAGHLQRPRRDQGRHRQFQGGAESQRRRGRLHDLGRARQRLADRATSTTRPTRSSCSPAPRRCARNTRRSSMPG